MSNLRIHLIAPAGPCATFYRTIGVESATALVDLIQQAVGPRCKITAHTRLFDAVEDELRGGRTDDAERAADLEEVLADSSVTAIVTLRGGAWFTRVLPRIDFSVLDRRTTPVAFFGFSELTPVANIVAAHPYGRAFYDMGPVFLGYGLRRYAENNPSVIAAGATTACDWMRSQVGQQFRVFFRRCLEAIEGRREMRVDAKPLRGDMDGSVRPMFVGGNLTVLSTLIGSPYEPSIAPEGKWILLEDYNDKPERFDRFLAHLTLAGYFDRCEGILLGDFHQQERNLIPAILEMIRYHAPHRRDLPILHAPTVGHTWPMDTLPLHAGAAVERHTNGTIVLHWPPDGTW